MKKLVLLVGFIFINCWTVITKQQLNDMGVSDEILVAYARYNGTDLEYLLSTQMGEEDELFVANIIKFMEKDYEKPCDFKDDGKRDSTPIALAHCSNTCFMASVLQSLYAIEPLTEFLIKLGRRRPSYYKQNSASRAYIELITKLYCYQQQERIKHNPMEFCQMAWRNLGCDLGAQEDAAFFYTQLINRLGEEDVNRSMEADDLAIENYIKEFCGVNIKSVVDGKIKPIVQEKKKPKLPYWPTLTLKILSNNFWENIERWRNEITEREDGQGRMTNILTYNSLTNFPGLLTIHLTPAAHEKIELNVNIPLELNKEKIKSLFDSTVVIPNNDVLYDLVAVVIHRGQVGQGGHYWAYVKANQHWYRCDDLPVRMKPIELISQSEMEQFSSNGYFVGRDVSQELINSGVSPDALPSLLFYQSRNLPVPPPIPNKNPIVVPTQPATLHPKSTNLEQKLAKFSNDLAMLSRLL